MDEVYENAKYYKSSMKSGSYSPQKKNVSFTPMTSKAFQIDFQLSDNEDQPNSIKEDTEQTSSKRNRCAPKRKVRHHHSMLEFKFLKKDDSEKDVYDDLMQIILSDANHNKKGRLRKESRSSMALTQHMPKKEIIDTTSFTNTEVISDFYEYTSNCMELILQIRQHKREGKKVDFGFDLAQKKRIAVFDLDETLVHCVGSDYKKGQHRIEVKLPLKKTVQIGINIRPNLKKALKLIIKRFHIVVYTASLQAYSDAVLNYMDPKKKYFNHRLYRHHCLNETLNKQQVYIKDLRILQGVDLKDVIIIDNSVLSFAYQLDNGIPILPYYNEEKDSELGCLAYYLLAIDSSYEDLREGNKKYINIKNILQNVKNEIEQEEEATEEEEQSSTPIQRRKSVASIELLQRYESIKEQFNNFTFRDDKRIIDEDDSN